MTADVERYLTSLEAELKALPAEERREIILETRSHVLERSSRSPEGGVPEVLAELGPPRQYARRFLAAAGASSDRPFAVVAQLGDDPGIAVPVIAMIAVAYSLAVLAVVVATTKLLNPSGVGMWIDQLDGTRRLIFRVSPSSGGRPGEILGWWLVPLGYGMAALIHVSVTAALRRLGRWLQRRGREQSSTSTSG